MLMKHFLNLARGKPCQQSSVMLPGFEGSQRFNYLNAKPASLETDQTQASPTTVDDVNLTALGKMLRGQHLPEHPSLSSKSLTSGRWPAQRQIVLQALRRYNITLPYLRNQAILAKVIAVRGSRVLLDSGYFGISSVARKAVNVSHLHTQDAKPVTRQAANDIRPGDLVKVRLMEFFSPFGSPTLGLTQSGAEVQIRMVWEELKQAMEQNLPVKGRVLNTCTGGYAVGVSGIVAKLPYGQASGESTQKIGVLQPFYVTRVEPDRMVVELCERRYKQRQDRISRENLYSNI